MSSKTAMITRKYRAPHSDTTSTGSPFHLVDKQLFDEGDLLIATFEREDEAQSLLPLLNVKQDIQNRLAIAWAEKASAKGSGYDRDYLRLDGVVGVLESLLEDI
jgi:hypothetical protein